MKYHLLIQEIDVDICPINIRWWDRGLPLFWQVTEDQSSIPEREPEKWLPLPRRAAGAKLTQYRSGEVVTRCTYIDSKLSIYWNELSLDS